MTLIEINHLTKDYGSERGIFDINLSIEKGQSFGFVGTNGAGKSTTIRHLMGFLKPQKGNATIDGLDCWHQSSEIMKKVGYIPGEIAFPDAKTGEAFLKGQADLLGIKDMTYANSLIEKLQLDPTANLKRMSKGMKQKTAIVAALIAEPEILIFDEPTTGLDPLMREIFVEIIEEERKKGRTIFMSSHMFDEVEELCDQVALIKEGRIVAVKSTEDIKHNENKNFKIEFKSIGDYERFVQEDFDFKETRVDRNQVIFNLNDHEVNRLFKTLKNYDVKFMKENKYTLEQYFNNLYSEGNK
ncbi:MULTISPECIES: ABC transporter ATP-binding protein [Enterococcus]|uniref:ABC transporter ATP-binding protein n=2 Tax=Enterococcus TaxID=1350 RepID=UPI0022E78B87|nr:ATP-binding cassette domain-containing protein [Enterococcus asini]